MMPLTLASAAGAEDFLPGLKIVKSRPRDSEIMFTMPGDGATTPATVRFRFDPLEDGAATEVHAFVDVPPIAAFTDGEQKTLSEAKVTGAVQDVLNALAQGKSASATEDCRDPRRACHFDRSRLRQRRRGLSASPLAVSRARRGIGESNDSPRARTTRPNFELATTRTNSPSSAPKRQSITACPWRRLAPSLRSRETSRRRRHRRPRA